MANPKAQNITQFQKLKFFSLLETISLLLLVVVAVPLKYFNGWDTGCLLYTSYKQTKQDGHKNCRTWQRYTMTVNCTKSL